MGESITPTVTTTVPTSANEGVVSIQTITADPNPQPNPGITQLPEPGQEGTESSPAESSGEEEKNWGGRKATGRHEPVGMREVGSREIEDRPGEVVGRGLGRR